MTTTAPERQRLTSQTWSGHWHGFGPWVGPPETYAKEGNRRPAHPIQPAPESDCASRYREAASEFATGSVPPLMTGHWLLKRGQATRARTWTDCGDAVGWLKQHYIGNPPFERTDGLPAYAGLDVTLAYALDVLPRGVDVSCVHYTQSRGLFSASVVCCPNLHHPDLACPLPPA
ncbi:hypothetical protein SSP24_75810 [Streptomyces spinoverrucosus]|uniref:Uncharacterized protein n=1 Tax=Streptomyces spinoverrucosus TaxID=284043 RepID=A0A4Y3VY21_9ACTN|nr:hypothetical protein [Streptomyces spinoverrucosus]GEC09926.1 hypothetical protein SSP24_75810 [Streptomyces spinoverrucosus]GHB66774.1 hypothetical protein GCM10010397_41290 [Streptomyces spinoverrucosus]